MLAAVWHGRRDIRVEEFPDPPSPGKKEVKIRVEWAGICGTDLEEYCFGPLYIPVDRPNPITGRKAPMILGHEFVGTVIEKGSAVTEFKIGDRITPDTALFCGECYYCKRNLVHFCDKLALLGLMTDGGFAQYVNAPTYMCYKLPANVAPELGALAEPTAVARMAMDCGKRLSERNMFAVKSAGKSSTGDWSNATSFKGKQSQSYACQKGHTRVR